MKKMIKDFLFKKGVLYFLFTAFAISACTKMDDTYKEFIKDGQIKYVGKAENAVVMPGRNRLLLRWPAPSDPKAIMAKVYWNNRTDSLEIPIERSANGNDTVEVAFNNLNEGPYVFEIITFDGKGNSSVKVEARGRVYGSTYENRLLSRPADRVELYQDTLKIEWGAAPDTTVIGSEVIFKDASGKDKVLFVPVKDLRTDILKFPAQETIKHRTLFLPSRLAIDTFYSVYTTSKIKGPPIELSKTGWTATESSFDNRSGSSYRPGSNAIDGNPSTIWVNQISPQEDYPHTITVDMGSVHTDIEGFAFITRVSPSAARPKTVELFVSIDNITWNSMGNVDLANSGDKQFFSIPKVNARYFRVVAKNAHDNGKNIALAEVGLYTR